MVKCQLFVMIIYMIMTLIKLIVIKKIISEHSLDQIWSRPHVKVTMLFLSLEKVKEKTFN